MLKIKLIAQIGVMVVLLMNCTLLGEIPKEYLRNPRRIDTMSLGCWISVNQMLPLRENPEDGISGELIAVQNDTFNILTRAGMVAVPVSQIRRATLFLFKSQGSNFLLATGLGLLPNLAGVIINDEGAFLAVGIPYMIIGGYMAVTNNEHNSDNKLVYPEKNTLKEFGPFSRFPQGMPPGMKAEELTLRMKK